MKKIFSLLTVYFLLTTQCFATTGVPDSRHWEYAGFGGAGAFPMIVHDHFTSGKLYGIPDVNSPFVTTNKADNWSFLSTVGAVNNGFTPTQTASFVQSKTDANLMFALDSASGGLARSIDGGQHWTKVASFGNIKGRPVIAIDKNDDNKVYVASYQRLWVSSDKGITWTNKGFPFASRAAAYTTKTTCESAGGVWSTSLSQCLINISFIYHDTVNEDLYLGSRRFGIARYDLATDTVDYIDFTGTNALYNASFDTYIDGSSVENFCVSTGNRIACTADFSTWTYTAVTTASSSYYINAFAIHRKADTTLNIVANSQSTSSEYTNSTYYSTNGGSTWSVASRNNNTTMNPTGAYNAGNLVFYIEDSPFVDGEFYLSTDWRFYRSDNSGANFAEKVAGAPMQVAHDLAIAPNGDIVQVSMDTGIQVLRHGTTTWLQGVPNATQPFVTGSINDYGGHYWQVETAGTPEEWDAGQGKIFACATMYGTNTALYAKNYLVRSLNSGTTWTRSNSGLPTVPLGGDAVWSGFLGWGGFCRAMALSADESKLYIAMDGENGSQTGGLFMSEDDGATFTRIWSSPRKIFNALAVDPTDTSGKTLMFGAFGYNNYRSAYVSESAELNGSGQTRTGNLNNNNFIVEGSVTFTSSGGEVFTGSLNTAALTSNLGGTGTLNHTTGAYSLTFVSAPSATTVTYNWRGYVSAADYIVDEDYDTNGTPYAVANTSGPSIYKSVTTQYGDGSGQWGTWIKMKQFGSYGMADGLVVDKRNKNRIFVSVTEGPSPQERRIYVTVDANKDDKAKWYDISGDFPVAGGCRALKINYLEGDKGYLYCASNGGGLWKLALDDSPTVFPGRMVIGGNSLE